MSQSDLGSVYRRKDQRWVAALSVGGKRVCRYGHSRKEAQEALLALLKERGAGTLARPTTTTLGQWITEWLTMVEPERRPKTMSVYRAVLMPVAEQLGHQKLHRLTPLAFANLIATMRRQGRGRRALEQTYIYLRVCLDRAVALQLLGENPLRRVARPTYVPAERRIWSTDETRRFLAVARRSPHRHALQLMFLIGTGCRLGESLGITWEAVDLVNRTARIQQALVVVDRKPLLQGPKTRAGIRTVGLPDFVVEALERLDRRESEYVFRTVKGTVPTKQHLHRVLRGLCRQADVSIVSLHSLRHLNASLALSRGVPLPDVSRHLGHANPGVTAKVYSHALGDGRAVVQALEAALLSPQVDPGAQAD